MGKSGQLFVVSGPSGAGKSTVIGKMMAHRDDVSFSVSVTTRAPRPGEVDGVDYYFVTRERYDELVREGGLLEHAVFAGNGYGTPRQPVLKTLASGRHVLLDIEVQGAAQVKEAMSDTVTIFLAPPTLEELERRLRSRGTESDEKIRQRLDTARRELLQAKNYDYLVVNDDPDRAAAELSAILDRYS